MVFDRVEELRNQGNEHFRAKRYWNAIECYTKALENNYDVVSLSNRAQAYLCLKKNEEALVDSRLVTEWEPTAIKGFYRYGLALCNLGLYKEAEDKLKIAMRLKKNEQISKLLEDISGKQNVEELRVMPVNKCEAIRSSKPLRELTLEIDKTADDEAIDNADQVVEAEDYHLILKKNSELPPVPSTSYQFLADYESLANNSMQFCRYFLAISTDNYNKILDDILDPDMIISLIDGCSRIFPAESCEFTATQAANALIAMGGVKGFSLALMFLQEENKAALRSFLERNSIDLNANAVISQIYDL